MLPLVSLATTALSLLAVSHCLAHGHDGSSPKSPTATVEGGKIIGTTTSLAAATATINQFLGLPFASPPERFSLPTKPKKWRKTLDASKRKPACIQQFNYPAETRKFTMDIFNDPPPEESEDCLYLNVFAPSTPPPKGGYPVLFWIYGGSLMFGSAGQPGYDGSSFASYEDTIVVTTNYRTNVFGFPNSPELPITAQNLGFYDQRAALSWVQRNIASFGGNPQKVTLFGESAGALSVDVLVTSFPTRPPFRAAIMQSGQASLARFMARSNSTVAWNALVTALGCASARSHIACVRKVPAVKVKDAIERAALGFNPVRDNVTFVSDPAAARVAKKIAAVPVLLGSNAQEGRVFSVGQNNLTAYLDSTFPVPALAAAVKKAYPIGSPGIGNDYDAISAIYTDLVFGCPAASLATFSASAGYPTHRYLFNASFPNLEPPGLDLGVYHSAEISLVFSTYPAAGATPAQEALSNYMRGAWARFARNPKGGPGWAGVGTGKGGDLGVLGGDGWGGVRVVEEEVVDARCALFAPIYAALSS